MTRPYEARDHWAWLCELDEFGAALDRRRKLLNARRRGLPYSNYGPEQLLELGQERANRLVGSLTDPRSSELAGVVPLSLRLLPWVLCLGDSFDIAVPPGPSIHPEQQDRLQALCLRRLARDRLSDAERQFVGRTLKQLDPGSRPIVRVPRRDNPSTDGWVPALGEPIAVHATAAADGWPIASPSWAGHPVMGELVAVDSHDVVFRL